MNHHFKIGSIASGMGMHLHGLKQIGGVPVWAIECDEAIAHCYHQNHKSEVYIKKVQDVAPSDLADIDLLITTLSCKNASIANANRGELPEDAAAGIATGDIIKALKPQYFMLENVWGYRKFESFKQIQAALDECGYYSRFYKFNCRNWGIAQSRDRLYLLASKDGTFADPVPPQISEVGWYEVIADLIDELPETTLAPWQLRKFPELAREANSCLIPDHSNWTNLIPQSAPCSTVREGHQTFKALIKRAGGGRDSDRLYQSDEPSFTIRAMGRKSDNHSRIADAIVGDRIVAVTPRACLRFFGDKETADNIWLPPTKSLANEVVGNGASWVMFKSLFEHLSQSVPTLLSIESNSLRDISTSLNTSGGEMVENFFQIGDRVELVCDVLFGDINLKAKNPNAKLAIAGECAEVCGVRGTRLALSVGGEPFDCPIRLVKKNLDVPTADTAMFTSEQGIGTQVENNSHSEPCPPPPKESDKWYTPPNIQDLLTQVLGAVDLDPCADDGKHIKAANHYTASDDGLAQEWYGRVFMNPPYSCPGKWMAKLQAEIEAGRVTEAIALVPAATDTNWLHPLLDTQPICFWKGRIKFLDTNYQPKLSARQSHCLLYWGTNAQKFKQVFDEVGTVKNISQSALLCETLRDGVSPSGRTGVESETAWNPADFGEVPRIADGDQLTIFYDTHEPPDPDNYPSIAAYEQAWQEWEKKLTRSNVKQGVHVVDQLGSLGIIKENLGFGFVVDWLGDAVAYNWERDSDRIDTFKIANQGRMKEEGGRSDEVESESSSLFPTLADSLPLRYLPSSCELPNQVFKNKEQNTVTTFQFSGTQAIASQIAQLQEQLNKLTASLEPYQECEQKAEELRQEVAQFGREMVDKGIPQNDILSWARSLYSAASGVELVESDSSVIAAQNEIISELKAGNHVLREQYSEVIRQRDLLIKQVEDNDNDMDVQLAEQQLIPEVEASNKELTEGVASFTEGDRVCVNAIHELEHLLERLGTVVGIKGNSIAVLFDATDNEGQHEIITDRSNLVLLLKATPDNHAHIKASNFIATIRTKAGANNINWQNISELCQGNHLILKELLLTTTTKIQKELIQKLPQLMADYIA
ncbi:hypothetical protein A6769_38560 [Nostoc punctiforme NIES-2108]|nr:hypothetical protein A6769_38560 [Nostoc punctiforme NIES-2108]